MMKKMISIALAISLVVGASAFVYADDRLAVNEVTTVNSVTVDEKVVNDLAGVLPDSPWYRLERKIEQLQIEITHSQENLAALKAKLAAERAAESIIMAKAEEDEFAIEAANEYVKLFASSAKHINKAIAAKEDAIKIMESLNESYTDSEQLLETMLSFYEAKEKLNVAKMELKIAREGGGPETIQIAEDKVKEAEALKEELEELKNAAESAKEEVGNLADKAENRIEKGFKQIEKANAKMDKLDEKATKETQKLEEKTIKENNKQLEKDKKEEEKSEKKLRK